MIWSNITERLYLSNSMGERGAFTKVCLIMHKASTHHRNMKIQQKLCNILGVRVCSGNLQYYRLHIDRYTILSVPLVTYLSHQMD